MTAFDWLPGANDPDAREALEQNEEMQKAAMIAAREKARLFHDVFTTGRGPELLELLRLETIDLDLMAVSPVIGGHLREMGVNPSEWAYHRNGQNSVVRYIFSQIRQAQLAEQEEVQNA